MKKIIALSLAFTLTACLAPSNKEVQREKEIAEVLRIAEDAKKASAELAKDRVNENWTVRCNTDPVKDTKTCFAGTFGSPMSYDGQPYNKKSIPFQVKYINDIGPLFMVGFNTYPGKEPTVKIDGNQPITINKYGYAGGNAEKLIFLLETGSVLRGEYHSWPRGAERMYVELEGFPMAYQKLMELVNN